MAKIEYHAIVQTMQFELSIWPHKMQPCPFLATPNVSVWWCPFIGYGIDRMHLQISSLVVRRGPGGSALRETYCAPSPIRQPDHQKFLLATKSGSSSGYWVAYLQPIINRNSSTRFLRVSGWCEVSLRINDGLILCFLSQSLVMCSSSICLSTILLMYIISCIQR